MKNTIWFFGDCFVSGISLRPHDPYYKYKQEGDKLWTDIVAEELNMNLYRPGSEVGLTAFPWVINEFIKHLDTIKKGDIVIFGETMPDGVLTFNEEKDKVHSFNCYDIFDYKSCWSWRTEEEMEKTLPYIAHHKVPYREQWTKFYKEQVHNIGKEILNRGVKTFYWSRSLWDKFEKISDVSDNPSNHWSWKGQKQMAEHILNMIKEDKYIKQKSI